MAPGTCSRLALVLMVSVWVALVGIMGFAQSSAAAPAFGDSQYEMGLRFGYGQTYNAGETVRFYDWLPRWGIFLTQPGNSVLGNLRLSLVIEGVIGVLEAGHSGWELGFTPLLKVSYPLSSRVLGYIEGGAGIVWENIDSPTYAHVFNFSPQIGAGLDIKIVGNFALTLAYRFRHTSNAGIYDENRGVNSNFGMVGVNYYY